MADVVMPRLSDSMEEGTILTWLKQVGDEVAVGDELVEIETDKANMAYEADVAGTLTEILAGEGDTLAIGEPIAVVGDADGASAPAAETPASAENPAAPERPAPAEPAPADGPNTADIETFSAHRADGERVKASPVARRLAKEHGIDLATLTGSGPGGRIVKKDVKNAAKDEAAPLAATPQAAGLPPSTQQVEGGR